MEEEEEGGHRRAEVASRRRPSVSRERPSEDEREREEWKRSFLKEGFGREAGEGREKPRRLGER
jgi:hypothetical protein